MAGVVTDLRSLGREAVGVEAELLLLLLLGPDGGVGGDEVIVTEGARVLWFGSSGWDLGDGVERGMSLQDVTCGSWTSVGLVTPFDVGGGEGGVRGVSR